MCAVKTESTGRMDAKAAGGVVTADSLAVEGRVPLWTRQDCSSLEHLAQVGRYRADAASMADWYGEIADHYMELYRWFVRTAARRIPPPPGVEFPVWCSISSEYCLRAIPGTVVYELSVDPAEMLLFDGGKWDMVLNHRYVPADAADAAAYERELKEKGFPAGTTFVDPMMARRWPMERDRVVASWERIFTVESPSIFTLQANLWEIRPDQLVRFSIGDRVYEKADLLDLVQDHIPGV